MNIQERLLRQKKTIYDAQLFAIKSAKKRIYIQNPYLADYRIINALIEARGRGVDVRVIIPSKNNVGMMASSNLVTTNIFLKNGIKVYNVKKISSTKIEFHLEREDIKAFKNVYGGSNFQVKIKQSTGCLVIL